MANDEDIARFGDEEVTLSKVLVGDVKVLDYLATKFKKETREHSLQERLEEIVKTVLTVEEQELYFMRFGEQQSYRQIAKKFGYTSHRTFQLQINAILKKVKEALSEN